MEAVAHSPSFAKKVGVPKSVGEDFSAADKGRKFSKGGEMKKKMMGKGAPADMPMPTRRPMSRPMPPAMPPGGGMAPPASPMGMKKGGATKKMASGGSASSRADGVAKKGLTKGKMLKKGGAC